MKKRMRVIYFPGTPQERDIPYGGVAYYVPSLQLWAIVYPADA